MAAARLHLGLMKLVVIILAAAFVLGLVSVGMGPILMAGGGVGSFFAGRAIQRRRMRNRAEYPLQAPQRAVPTQAPARKPAVQSRPDLLAAVMGGRSRRAHPSDGSVVARDK